MKKVISISLLLVALTALLHLSLATHYCGGNKVSSIISLTGKLATCGMEDQETGIPLTGNIFTSHCCDNELVFFGVTGNYFPSYYSLPESYRNNVQIINLSPETVYCPDFLPRCIRTNMGPPDSFLSSDVDLSGICVYRI